MSNLSELLKSREDLSLLNEAITELGFSETLSGSKKFTIFAPSNDAISQALTSLNLTKEGFLGDKVRLEKILNFHIIPDEVIYSKNVKDEIEVKTLNDDQHLEISEENDNFIVNGTNVSIRDLVADNGVVHIIDRVLLPQLS